MEARGRGVGLGALGALLQPVIDAQLTGLTTANAGAVGGAAALLILAAPGACLLSARRAMTINPGDALKE